MCGRANVCTGSGSMRTVHGAVEILKNWKLAQYFLLYNCTSLLQLYFLQVPPRSGEEKSVERDRRGLEVGGRSASARSGKSGKSAKVAHVGSRIAVQIRFTLVANGAVR